MLSRQFGIVTAHRLDQLERAMEDVRRDIDAHLKAEADHMVQMRADLADMRAQIAALAAKRGPGRPPKEKQ